MSRWKSISIYVAFCSVVLMASACGKHAIKEQGAQDSTVKPATSTDSLDSNLSEKIFAKICSDYFDYLNATLKTQIEGNEKDFSKNLQSSVAQFAKDINMDITSEDLLKDGQCTALARLATRVQQSDVVNNYNDLKNKRPWIIEPKSFNSLSFTMELLLKYFMQSLDQFSHFDGYYDRFFSDAGPYDWQIQFLNRSDYQQIELSSAERNKNRKPQYLYVQFAPKYLVKDLPVKTRVFKVNDRVVKDNFYGDLLREMSRSKVLKLEVQKPTQNGAYGPMESVTLMQQQLEDSHEIIFQILEDKPYKIGYLRIPDFMDEQSSKNLFQALDPKVNPQLNGMIVDLRNNMGGNAHIVSQIIGSFFKDKVITGYRVYADGTEDIEEVLEPYNPLNSYGKVIVLTDFQTISAAETMTASLQDSSAVLVTGSTTFGKGIGQVLSRANTVDGYVDGDLTKTTHYLLSRARKSWYLTGNKPDIGLYEPAYDGIEKRLKDLPTGSFPKPLAEIKNESFDLNVDIISERVTNDIRAKLAAFYNSASDDEKKCKSFESLRTLDPTLQSFDLTKYEEDSCMFEWSKIILKKWIEIQPNHAATTN